MNNPYRISRSVIASSACVMLWCSAFAPCLSWAGDVPDLTTRQAKLSYSAAYQVVDDLKKQGIILSPEELLKGAEDAVAGNRPRLSEEDMRASLVELQKAVLALQAQRRKTGAEQTLAAGRQFLAENAGKEGIVTLPSGLQYRVLNPGAGAAPKETDTVTVQYRGTLIDGTEFDNSYKRAKPPVFRIDSAIGGWKEALTRMSPGSKWQLFVPPDLAYGETGSGMITPNSTLIFELELLSVVPAK